MKNNLSLLLILSCMLFSCAKNIDTPYMGKPQHTGKPHGSNTKFNKLYGGSSEDYLRAVTQGNYGGYIFTGETYSNGSSERAGDVWIVKVDEAGNRVWEKTYGGSQVEQAYSIAKCKGGYLIAGRMYSTDGDAPATHGDGDGFVLKIDESGNLVRQKTFGGSDFDEFVNIQPDGNGNYILVGNTQSSNGDVNGSHGAGDAWVVKMDGKLNILWQKALGGSQSDGGNSVVINKDGTYIISGSTSSADGDVKSFKGGLDFWIMKLSGKGKLLWEKTFGGTGFELPNSITGSVDGGYLISGLTTSSDGDVTVRKGGVVDAWMIKIDKDGNLQWDKTVGGTGFDQCLFSMTTRTGDYLIGGGTTSNDGDLTGNHGGFEDGWIMRINKQGKEKWTKVTGGSSGDQVNSACAGNRGNYILAGTSNSNDGDVSGNHGFTDAWLFTLEHK